MNKIFKLGIMVVMLCLVLISFVYCLAKWRDSVDSNCIDESQEFYELICEDFGYYHRGLIFIVMFHALLIASITLLIDGVKDQSNTYRIRKGVFYKGFDVFTEEEVDKEIKLLKSEGLKYFVVYFKEEGFFRIFAEEKSKGGDDE